MQRITQPSGINPCSFSFRVEKTEGLRCCLCCDVCKWLDLYAASFEKGWNLTKINSLKQLTLIDHGLLFGRACYWKDICVRDLGFLFSGELSF